MNLELIKRVRVFSVCFVGLFFFFFQIPVALLSQVQTGKDEKERPFGIEKRTAWTTSRVVGRPEPPLPYAVERVFPKQKFDQPVFVAQEPGTDRLVVAEVGGKIHAFSMSDTDGSKRDLFCDTNRQLYAFSFHPDYETNGQIFVFSPVGPGEDSDGKKSRVSRFQTTMDHPRRVLPETEETIIEWPSGGHNGGEAIIGPDGYLYIATGDGTSGSDLKNTGQGVDDLFSVIMRIDVEHPDEGRSYSIPEDNPFVNYPGARSEIWAFGFRNPWRMSFDQKTEKLWVGDVGQDLWEMIWIAQPGGNYGWSVQEGSHPFHPNKKVGPGPILPPVVEHHHVECRSITGGYVYTGNNLPELEGAYLYGDYQYGRIWGVRSDGKETTWHEELTDSALMISSFGLTRSGDFLILDHSTGEIHRLIRNPYVNDRATFPRKLSETGLFSSVPSHDLAPGVIPYSVNAPQWLNNATKERFVALPDDSKINFVERSADANTWNFDDGAVHFETISLEMEFGNPASRKRIETRMTVKQQNHWLGYSYLWNDEQTDAILVGDQGLDLKFMISDASSQGQIRQQTWHVPSRNECMVCHSRAAGFVLGVRTAQMNRDHSYVTGVSDNQLRAFEHIGLFKTPLDKNPEEYDSLVNPYREDQDIDARARAYLHVNCSICHVSDGGGNAKLQLKYYQKLEETHLINEPPMHGRFDLGDASIVVPGDPFSSVLFYRISKLGMGRMPHIGAQLTDQKGLNLIYDWIAQLKSPDQKNQQTYRDEYVQVSEQLKSADADEEQRARAIDKLLGNTRSAFVLSRVLGDQIVTSDMRQAVISTAMKQNKVTVRDLFERFVPEESRIKRLGTVIDPPDILSLTGDVESGRQLFMAETASQCKNCHRINEEGESIGPDLGKIGKKYKLYELLESLVQPSKKIEEKYITYVLVDSEGKVFTGILVEKSAEKIVFNAFSEGQTKRMEFSVDEVEELIPQPKSLMPELLLRDLTAQQAADLLAFLASLK